MGGRQLGKQSIHSALQALLELRAHALRDLRGSRALLM